MTTLRKDDDECQWYFLAYGLDCTLGTVINITLLIALSKLAIAATATTPSSSSTDHNLTSSIFNNGDYGDPPRIHVWAVQLTVWLAIIVASKAFLWLFFVLFAHSLSTFVESSFYIFEGHRDLELVVVMIIFPCFLNIAQFWIQDTFLMQRPHNVSSNSMIPVVLSLVPIKKLSLTSHQSDGDFIGAVSRSTSTSSSSSPSLERERELHARLLDPREKDGACISNQLSLERELIELDFGDEKNSNSISGVGSYLTRGSQRSSVMARGVASKLVRERDREEKGYSSDRDRKEKDSAKSVKSIKDRARDLREKADNRAGRGVGSWFFQWLPSPVALYGSSALAGASSSREKAVGLMISDDASPTIPWVSSVGTAGNSTGVVVGAGSRDSTK